MEKAGFWFCQEAVQIMAEQVYSILTKEDTEAVEKYGELSGTDKQRGVIRAAIEAPEAEPAELAEQLDAGEGYVRNVLRRAEHELIREIESDLTSEPETESGETEEPEEPAEGEEGEPVERPTVDPDEAEPSAVWRGAGVGELVEVSAMEWCDECQERHRVTYLVPSSEIGYLTEPACGHGGAFANGEPHEGVQRVIEALKRRARV